MPRFDSAPVWRPVSWLFVAALGAGTGLVVDRAAEGHLVDATRGEVRRVAAAIAPAELDALAGVAADATGAPYRTLKDRLIRLSSVEPDGRILRLVRQPAGPGAAPVVLADSRPADAPGAGLPGTADPALAAWSAWETVRASSDPVAAPQGADTVAAAVLVRDRGPSADRDFLVLDQPAAAARAAARQQALLMAGLAILLAGVPLGVAQVLMSDRRRARQAQLRRLAEALDRSVTPILLVDAADRMLHVNQGAARAFGYAAPDLVGRDWRQLGERPAESDAERGAQLRAGRPWQGSWLGRRRDGSTWPVRGQASPVLTEGGDLTAFVVVLEDLTTVRRHEDELAAARERAEAGDRAKGHFLSTLSHEVRTPLNGVIGFAGLLLDTPLNPEQREYALTIRSSSEALIDLTTQVLDFSRLEQGKVTPQLQPCGVRDVIEDVLEIFAGRAAEKGIELLHAADPAVPAAILADRSRLRQILVNLVSNAVKFTAAGEVEVSVAPEPGRDRLRFTVRDTGPGLSSADRARLFQPFAQTDSALGQGGSGLGLAISRGLVEVLGGSIGVESEPGQGARFHFTLPAPVAETSDVVAAIDAPVVALTGLEIAICSRQPGLRAELVRTIESWGAVARPVAALPLPPAPLALVDCDPDTADLALRTPASSGWKAARTIGLVPLNLPAEARQVMRSHFASLLSKPARHRALRAAAIALLRPPGTTDTHTPFASLDLKVLIVEDNRTSQVLLQRILDSLGCAWSAVPNGRRALDELGVNDYDVVLMDLHMPELDGVTATRLIRSGEAGPVAREVWIAAVTADPRREQRDRAFAAGVNDYLQKPVALADVESALRRYRAERSGA